MLSKIKHILKRSDIFSLIKNTFIIAANKYIQALSFLFLFLPSSLAQSGIQFWNTEQGLSNNVISKILQDEQGYIWIATQKPFCNNNPRLFWAGNNNSRNGNNVARLLFISRLSCQYNYLETSKNLKK